MDTAVENSWLLLGELPPPVALLVVVLVAVILGGAWISRRATSELWSQLLAITGKAYDRQEQLAVALMAVEARLQAVETAIRNCPAGAESRRGQ